MLITANKFLLLLLFILLLVSADVCCRAARQLCVAARQFFFSQRPAGMRFTPLFVVFHQFLYHYKLPQQYNYRRLIIIIIK